MFQLSGFYCRVEDFGLGVKGLSGLQSFNRQQEELGDSGGGGGCLSRPLTAKEPATKVQGLWLRVGGLGLIALKGPYIYRSDDEAVTIFAARYISFHCLLSGMRSRPSHRRYATHGDCVLSVDFLELPRVLKGSWDSVSRFITGVIILIITYL